MDLEGKKGYIGFSHAWNGLKVMVKERNFRIHLIATLLVILAGIFFKLNVQEWSLLILVVGAVLISEVFNSIVEQMIDYIKPEIHPTAKRIKDMAAGSVLLATIVAVIIGIFIFFPKIIDILL